MLQELHKKVLYTQVRVKTDKAGGSGTIIYSQGSSTYAVTCAHVVEDAISVKKEWDSKLGKEVKKEYRQIVSVEFFDYENTPHGRRPISYSVDGEIIAYDKPHDMALVKLRVKKPVENVAKLLAKERVSEMKIGSRVFAVGCALLHDPILTEGMITHMGDEIDYKDYWMSSAQIIFGNSGGAVFTAEGFEFIGIPSRVDIVGWGNPVTHLGYFSPVTRIYQFLEEQVFQFIYDSKYSEAQCEALRRKIREEARRMKGEEEEPVEPASTS